MTSMATNRKIDNRKKHRRLDLNEIGVELALVELEVANVWLEIATDQSAPSIRAITAKARAVLFTADLIMGQLTMKESVRKPMTDARNNVWARLRLFEARANAPARVAA